MILTGYVHTCVYLFRSCTAQHTLLTFFGVMHHMTNFNSLKIRIAHGCERQDFQKKKCVLRKTADIGKLYARYFIWMRGKCS